ncbi:MAG: Mur ligase family protein [Coriobacteriia bacterium]|nr:Mur ligase family protein [Coriobacteriia bacterium]
MKAICTELGNPQQNYRCIQVGGTNGKSSTSRYLAALLQASGHSVGLYTSPELVSITERIEINGTTIDEESFADAVILVHKTAVEAQISLTEFELITAAALLIFAQHEVDFAVLEVGLGGRWDATSVVSPVVAVLTGVDLDHTAILGDTIAEIAAEKAAIIKPSTAAVVAPTDSAALAVFKEEAMKKQARYIEVPSALEPECNSYQAQNKLTALTTARELLGSDALTETKAYQVMDNTVIPGRLEIVHTNPLVIIDAAHNPASARTLVESYSQPKATLLLAVLADKDASGIIQALAPYFAVIVVTQTSSSRAIPAHELASLVEQQTGKAPRTFSSPQEALAELLTQSKPIIATGSITLAGEVKQLLTD